MQFWMEACKDLEEGERIHAQFRAKGLVSSEPL